MAKIKIHHIDRYIYVFVFILIAIAGFVFFTSTAMTNTRATLNPKEAILTCYKNRKPEMCPDVPPQPGTDKNLKICNICYNKCMICVAAKHLSDKSCTATCVQDEVVPVVGDEEAPTATPIPQQ